MRESSACFSKRRGVGHSSKFYMSIHIHIHIYIYIHPMFPKWVPMFRYVSPVFHSYALNTDAYMLLYLPISSYDFPRCVCIFTILSYIVVMLAGQLIRVSVPSTNLTSSMSVGNVLNHFGALHRLSPSGK